MHTFFSNTRTFTEGTLIKAFVRMHTILAAHKELARKLEDHVEKTDLRFAKVYEVISTLSATGFPVSREKYTGCEMQDWILPNLH
jgi:hypothetical protein